MIRMTKMLAVCLFCMLAGGVARGDEADVVIRENSAPSQGRAATSAPSQPAVSPHLLMRAKVALAAFSPDGRVLMTVTQDDQQVHFWNIESGEEVNRFGVAVTQAIFSADGARVMTWGADRVARIFDGRTGKALRRLETAGEGVAAMAISPDGARALTSGPGATAVKLWDAISGQAIGTLEGHQSPVIALAFSPDGKQAISLSGQPAATPVQRMTGRSGSITTVRRAGGFSSRTVTTAPVAPAPAATAPATTGPAPEAALRLWDLETRKLVRKIDLPTPAQGAYFSMNGKLALVVLSNAARIYELGTGEQMAAPRAPEENFPAGLLSGDRKTGLWKAIGSAAITNALTGEQVRPLDGPIDGLPICNAFSQDGARVIVGTGKVALFTRNPNEPGKVYVYEVGSGKRLASFDGHRREVTQVALSHDGRRAFSRDADNTVFLWALPP